jgi:hypothetical protein
MTGRICLVTDVHRPPCSVCGEIQRALRTGRRSMRSATCCAQALPLRRRRCSTVGFGRRPSAAGGRDCCEGSLGPVRVRLRFDRMDGRGPWRRAAGRCRRGVGADPVGQTAAWAAVLLGAQSCPGRQAEMAQLATDCAAHAMSCLRSERNCIRSIRAVAAERAPGRAATERGRERTGGTAVDRVHRGDPLAGAPATRPADPDHLVGSATPPGIRRARSTSPRGAGPATPTPTPTATATATAADEGALTAKLERALHRRTPPDHDRGLGIRLVRYLAGTHGGRTPARPGQLSGPVMEVVLPRHRPQASNLRRQR